MKRSQEIESLSIFVHGPALSKDSHPWARGSPRLCHTPLPEPGLGTWTGSIRPLCWVLPQEQILEGWIPIVCLTTTPSWTTSGEENRFQQLISLQGLQKMFVSPEKTHPPSTRAPEGQVVPLKYHQTKTAFPHTNTGLPHLSHIQHCQSIEDIMTAPFFESLTGNGFTAISGSSIPKPKSWLAPITPARNITFLLDRRHQIFLKINISM